MGAVPLHTPVCRSDSLEARRGEGCREGDWTRTRPSPWIPWAIEEGQSRCGDLRAP